MLQSIKGVSTMWVMIHHFPLFQIMGELVADIGFSSGGGEH
uniref:Uncharacterized protein n=1 Tax=Anguilla anguilla TaxID=7936 RepID=A0A0E9Q8E6_ANGAN